MKLISTLLCLSLMGLAYSSVLMQSFSINATDALTDGENLIVSTAPVFTANELAGATQLEIELTLTGDAHQQISSTTGFGSTHAAESLTQVLFSHNDGSAALFTNLVSAQLASLDVNPVINGFATVDTSSLYPANPLSYSVTWSTTDQSLINSISGGSLAFQAQVSQEYGADAEFNALLGRATYANNRLEGVSLNVDYALTTTHAPEPSSAALLAGGCVALILRRKR